ncbi:MAG: HAMP domain-containing sensor histidine kinase [Proteobacteria bacterium]|nr:HAMP domain-containing sensor histidine kinase [Pseudomonadota bacterium]
MINTTRGLVRFQAIILTVIGLVLGCGFARQSLLSKWEQEANYRVAIVDATMARFRSELLRGEAKDIRIGLQDLSQIIGTRQFRLVLRNGLAIEISPPFARQISGSAQSKELTCVVVPLTWFSFFGASKCSVERSALFYDAGHRHYLAEVTWTVDQAVDVAIIVGLLCRMVVFVLAAIIVAYVTARVFESRLVGPLNGLATQLGAAAEHMLLGQPVIIESYAGHVVSEVKILTDTSAHHIEKIQALQVSLADALVYQAIADTTAMVAHDVRKPFSMLKTYLGMLARANDAANYKKIAAKVGPEIDRSLEAVNGMLADLLEVRSPSANLVTQDASPSKLIEEAVINAFRQFPSPDVQLEVRLAHRHMVVVDTRRVGRVFSNIIGNALQAISGGASLWLETIDRPDYIEFCVGNSGSLIPASDLNKIFDAYFSRGKKGGTGLGLAIAKKVVLAHGGDIYCRSAQNLAYPNGFVEFRLTLPKAHVLDSSLDIDLPPHSSALACDFSNQKDDDENFQCDLVGKSSLQASKDFERHNLLSAPTESLKPSVAIVEDNIFMLEAWMEALGADALVFGFASPEELFEAMNEDPGLVHSFACVVTDFHFDNSNRYDGLDVGKAVKSRASHTRVLLATDYDDGGLEHAAAFDHVISKEPTSFTDLALRFGLAAEYV